MRRAAPSAAAPAAAALLLVLVACGPQESDGAPTAPSTTAAATDAVSPVRTPSPSAAPDAATVRAQGVPLVSGPVTLAVLAVAPTTVTVTPDPDGSARATVGPGEVHVAAPEGWSLTVLDDGTVLVLDAAGTPVGGLAGGPAASVAPDLVRVAAAAGTDLWLTSSTLAGLDWGDREGGESLAVTPTAWARASGLAAQELTWAQLVVQEPRADSPTMHDQLLCHMLGAPDKARWNLEPWRPEVDAFAMIAARCNPE
ncbi:DUF2599 domain-containing protein [Cellulomonas fimi]|uniref:DUF2599 domain-containing protein n=1 Tax=Cellulomonas fimi TaxID=1708 RepID=UPI00234E1C86|nr:DUF2599 domain-containing protein [Cellulomonas fimi]MDC7121592.1 DUF2599 domain-containing protein [Cellulomonas fimi]